MTNLEESTLVRFLARAKRSTYAAQGDGASVAPALPGTKQLEFHDGELCYRDIYAGMARFVGQELVSRAGTCIWSMAYAGGLQGDAAQTQLGAVYTVLRAALRAVPEALPLRGPASYEADGLVYRCDVDGSLAAFHGEERVSAGSLVLYQLRFAGGMLG